MISSHSSLQFVSSTTIFFTFFIYQHNLEFRYIQWLKKMFEYLPQNFVISFVCIMQKFWISTSITLYTTVVTVIVKFKRI